jgi:hypothetical protein
MLKYRPMEWRQLKRIHDKGIAFWEAKVKNSTVGQGTRGSLNKRGQRLKIAHRKNFARGVRASGGGRKDHFKEFKVALKQWAELERGNGQTLDSHDLVEQFAFMVNKAVAHGAELQAKCHLSAAGRARLLEYRGRVERLKTKSYRRWYSGELMQFCEVRLLKPQRMLKLSYEEEQVRCKLTWQQFDRRM